MPRLTSPIRNSRLSGDSVPATETLSQVSARHNETVYPRTASAKTSSPSEKPTPNVTRRSNKPPPRFPRLWMSRSHFWSLDMAANLPSPPPFPWLNPRYAQHLLENKRFSALLCNKSQEMEDGKWLEEQVEAHRVLLWGFVERITEKQDNGSILCTCPKMSAGLYTWAWVNGRNARTQPRARDYIALLEHWIAERLKNKERIPKPPTDTSPNHVSQHIICSRLPVEAQTESQNGPATDLEVTCRPIFAQMFRVYAHLYYDHFIEPFIHLGKINELNMSFSLFLTTATNLNMLRAEDLDPMQPLIDLWASKGVFEVGSKIYQMANPYNPSFPAVI